MRGLDRRCGRGGKASGVIRVMGMTVQRATGNLPERTFRSALMSTGCSWQAFEGPEGGTS